MYDLTVSLGQESGRGVAGSPHSGSRLRQSSRCCSGLLYLRPQLGKIHIQTHSCGSWQPSAGSWPKTSSLLCGSLYRDAHNTGPGFPQSKQASEREPARWMLVLLYPNLIPHPITSAMYHLLEGGHWVRPALKGRWLYKAVTTRIWGSWGAIWETGSWHHGVALSCWAASATTIMGTSVATFVINNWSSLTSAN